MRRATQFRQTIRRSRRLPYKKKLRSRQLAIRGQMDLPPRYKIIFRWKKEIFRREMIFLLAVSLPLY